MRVANIMCVITARGGSKGLPGKNIRDFAGKPLIAHTIELAQSAREKLSKVVVSTDCEKIAKVAVEYGAEVPFLRPPHLATDEASSLSVLQHLIVSLEEEQGYSPDWVLLLQPTSPLRELTDIYNAIDIMNSEVCTSVIGVTESKLQDKRKLMCESDGYLRPSFETSYPDSIRRQDVNQTYLEPNGMIYLTKAQCLINGSFYGERAKSLFIPCARSIDIDNIDDFEFAEFLWIKRFGECRKL